MTAFALAAPSPGSLFAAPAAGKVVSVPRPALWAAFAFAFLALSVPDCCLTGHHAAGFGMEAFGSICRAAR